MALVVKNPLANSGDIRDTEDETDGWPHQLDGYELRKLQKLVMKKKKKSW